MTDDFGTIVDAVTQGDEAALDGLVDRCLPRLHAYVRLNMGAEVRAREGSLDIVQSVCREVLDGLGGGFEYRGERAFLGYVFQAALNKIRGRYRAMHRQKRDVRREAGDVQDLASNYATVATPSHNAMARESVEQLEAAFDGLPENYREVITQARILRMSTAEIAAASERTEDAVRALLGRGLRALSKLLPSD